MSQVIVIETNKMTAAGQSRPADRSGVVINSSGNSTKVVTNEAAPEDSAVDSAVDETPEEVVDGMPEGDLTETDADIDTDEAVADDGINIDGEIGTDDGISADDGMLMEPGFNEGGYMEPGYEGDFGMEIGVPEVKDPLLSSWPFVIGISAAVFIVSVALGALLARLKIKKGIDLYED